MSEPKISRTRAGDIADTLRDQILSGELVAGAKLPSEHELTLAYDVSRSVVREALQQLQASGLVESFQGRGTFVLTLPEQSPGAGGFVAMSRTEAAALLEYRHGVESESAALAASRRSPLHLLGIERALERFVACGRRPHDIIPADFDLHLRIASASGNRFIHEALQSLGPRMIMIQRAALPSGAEVSNTEHFERICIEHGAIVDAIRAGDSRWAAAAMRLHLAASRERLHA